MTLSSCRHAALGLALLGSFLLPHLARAAALPDSPLRKDVAVAGEPLETVLPRLGREFQVRLQPSRELAGQRVTLFVKDASITLIARGLQELLSVDREAIVFWSRAGEGAWTLEEGHPRRTLARRLRDQDLGYLREHLEREVEWVRRDAPRETAEAKGRESVGYRVLMDRFARAALLEALGEAGRERLLAGVPFVAQVGQLPPPLRDLFRQYQARQIGAGRPGSRVLPRSTEELDGYWLTLLLSRSPSDPRGSRILECWSTSRGFCEMRSTFSGQPEMQRPAMTWPSFRLYRVQPHEATAPVRRVSLTFAPAPDAAPGTLVRQNLDQVLADLARGADLNIIADGYLRPPIPFPANMEVKDYPLAKLLDQIARAWGCDWRFLDEDQQTLLLRARGWWMEDAVDVPQPLVEELRAALGQDRSPRLEDLLRLAELSKAQVHKLIECDVCPGASGLITPGFYDETGAKYCLQFFSRLPPELRQRALSPQGLPLKEAPPELVERWLHTTLVADVGAASPELQEDLVFRLWAGPDPGRLSALPGWVVQIKSPRERGTLCTRYIGPPAALAPRAPLPARP